jgi:hypothetical protein
MHVEKRKPASHYSQLLRHRPICRSRNSGGSTYLWGRRTPARILPPEALETGETYLRPKKPPSPSRGVCRDHFLVDRRYCDVHFNARPRRRRARSRMCCTVMPLNCSGGGGPPSVMSRLTIIGIWAPWRVRDRRAFRAGGDVGFDEPGQRAGRTRRGFPA